MVSFVEVLIGGGAVFGVGVLFGMLLYRLLWHVDTAVLRKEIADLYTRNRVLTDELIRLSNEVSVLQERLANMEVGAREVQQDLHAALRR